MRQVALITGAAGGGIGSHTAENLAAAGFSVAVHGRDSASVARVVDLIQAGGGTAIGVAADLTEADAPKQVVEETQKRLGPISALVHNAADGVSFKSVEELSLPEWRRDQAVILEAAFLISARTLPDMRKARRGRIVFVSSSAARRGSFGRAASYAACKAALSGLAKQIAIEYGPHGVTANVVSPSQIDTPRVRKGGRRTPEGLLERGRGIPLQRVGQPGDVAAAIAYLCSDAAAYVTGTVLPIDGGSALAGIDTHVR